MGPVVSLPHEETDQPIIAYRAWGVVNGLLSSVATSSQSWPRLRPFHAVCAKQERGIEAHEAPDEGCMCGIYAMRTVEALVDTLHYRPMILGRIALWGNVVVHEDGYRAEYAYPQLLFYGPTMDREIVSPVAANYGCEAAPMPDDLRVRMELLVKARESDNQGPWASSFSQWIAVGQSPQPHPHAALISVGANAQAQTNMISQATYLQMVNLAAKSLGISPQAAANIVNQQQHNTANSPAMQVNTPNGWRIPIWQRSGQKKKP